MQQQHLTVTQAAKLYGFARSTINRKLTLGRMSSTVRGDGVRVVALSELIRVWGEPPQAESDTQQDAPPAEVFSDMLEELRLLRSEVAELKQAMLRLPAPETPQEPPQATPEPTPDDEPAPHPFAAEMAALRARQKE